MLSRPLTAAVMAAALAPCVGAHDSVEFVAARQAPFTGTLTLTGGQVTVFESDGISLLGWIPLEDLGGISTGSDCWGYTSPSGREYAIMCTSDSIAFVEVTDPGKPVVIQTFPAATSLWRDVKVYEDHAYYVSEGGDGIQVVDMSNIDAGVVSLVGSAFGPGTSSTHNVVIDETSGFLYRTGGGGDPTEGLRIFSLANKSNPQFVASWDDRYVHDAQAVTYTSGPNAGKQIVFVYSEDTSGGGNPAVEILDVTNKSNIQKLGTLSYSSPAYSHQGWLSPDRQYLYLNDELDERSFGTPTTTRVADVSDLTNPFQVGTFTTGSDAVDHNLYTLGTKIYEANYRSGLRVFDATNPAAPVEEAWFDTYPQDDIPEFNGLWSVYPYLPSGTIVGSDIEKGLFLWKLGEPELAIDVVGGVPELLEPNGQTLDVSVVPAPGVSLQPGSVTLHYDAGAGTFDVPLAAIGGDDFRALLPSFTCGAEVTWYVTAQTTDGVTWSAPAGAPTACYGAVAASQILVLDEVDLETNPGWTVGAPSDTATTGIWERVNPVGTSAQPEDDVTPAPGTRCYVTGQGAVGGGLGDNDVDGGATTLRTGDFDLSGEDAVISYWRWYSNNTGGSPGADVFEVDISNNGGSTWTSVEVVGPSGPETLGGWIQNRFRVSDFVVPTSQVRLRFVASDEGDGSIVEAAIDDLRIERVVCETCQTDLGFGGPGAATLSLCGDELSSGGLANLSLTGAAANAPVALFVGLAQNPTPFKGGTLVPVPILLTLSFSTNGDGELTLPVPGGSGPFTAVLQAAISDGSQIKGVALSNAVEAVFGP